MNKTGWFICGYWLGYFVCWFFKPMVRVLIRAYKVEHIKIGKKMDTEQIMVVIFGICLTMIVAIGGGAIISNNADQHKIAMECAKQHIIRENCPR